jgi:hypothetical protein
MDAFLLHRYFSLNSVIECPKSFLMDGHVLALLFETRTVQEPANTAQVT